MKTHHFALLLVLVALLAIPVSAHPGKTDGSGGHTDHDTGEYHYHHGYPAHSHYDMDSDGDLDCPYNFVDKTDHSSGSSSDKTSSGASSNKTSSGVTSGNKGQSSNTVNSNKSNNKSSSSNSGSFLAQLLGIFALILLPLFIVFIVETSCFDSNKAFLVTLDVEILIPALAISFLGEKGPGLLDSSLFEFQIGHILESAVFIGVLTFCYVVVWGIVAFIATLGYQNFPDENDKEKLMFNVLKCGKYIFLFYFLADILGFLSAESLFGWF